MKTDFELRMFVRQFAGVRKSGDICEKRGAGNNAVQVRFDDAFVDRLRQSEIIGIDDEIFQIRISPAAKDVTGRSP